jgi:hypothetical protein
VKAAAVLVDCRLRLWRRPSAPIKNWFLCPHAILAISIEISSELPFGHSRLAEPKIRVSRRQYGYGRPRPCFASTRDGRHNRAHQDRQVRALCQICGMKRGANTERDDRDDVRAAGLASDGAARFRKLTAEMRTGQLDEAQLIFLVFGLRSRLQAPPAQSSARLKMLQQAARSRCSQPLLSAGRHRALLACCGQG